MRFDKLTLKAQNAFQGAQTVAEKYQHQAIDAEHLMLALLDQEHGLIKPLLQKLSVEIGPLKTELEKYLDNQAKVPDRSAQYNLSRCL